jgi:hypothetical protein
MSTKTFSMLQLASLLFVVAGSISCGFMGTEVGNGAKDSGGDKDKGKKAGSTPDDATNSGQEAPVGSEASEELDPLSEEKGAQDEAGVDSAGDNMGGVPTGAAQGSGNVPEPIAAQPLAVRLLGATCASPLSQQLQSPLRLREVNAGVEGPIDVTATKTGDTWSVSVPGHGDLFKVLASPVSALPYSVVVTTPEDEPLEQGFECGESTTDDSASLPGISGALQKVVLDVWLDDIAYKVTWYRKTAGASSTLERFEVEEVGTENATVLTASPPP